MKIAILGAGKQATGALEFLARFPQECGPVDIVLADTSEAQQKTAALGQQFKWSENITSIHIKQCDGSQIEELIKVLDDCDVAINCMPYFLAYNATLAAIKSKTHMVDLGGNNTEVQKQLSLDELARKAGITIIPDCGVAPGMVSLLATDGILNSGMDAVDDIKIRVGGLPANPETAGPLQYSPTFSLAGLINEYVEPVLVLRDGEIKTISPLDEVEEFFGGSAVNYRTLEAFTTSGGCSTLPHTFKDSIKNIDYKTLRYPGHLNALKVLQSTGCFDAKHIQALCDQGNTGDHDVIILRVILQGEIFPSIYMKPEHSNLGYKVTRTYNLETRYYYSDRGMRTNYSHVALQESNPKYPLISAMMQATAWPAMIVLLLLPKLNKPGVKRQEQTIAPIDFINELNKTDLRLQIEEHRYYG